MVRICEHRFFNAYEITNFIAKIMLILIKTAIFDPYLVNIYIYIYEILLNLRKDKEFSLRSG